VCDYLEPFVEEWKITVPISPNRYLAHTEVMSQPRRMPLCSMTLQPSPEGSSAGQLPSGLQPMGCGSCELVSDV